MTIEQQPDGPVISVQMLRGIAATMVMFVHFDTELMRLHHQPLGSFWLASGVDIFFVISGFIMWSSVERRPGVSAREFLRNRIIRIVPLYWLVTAFVVAVVLIAPRAARTTALEPLHVLSSFLFLPARHPETGQFWPVVVPGWSLNYEMLFYVVFAVALSVSKGARLTRFILIFGLLIAILASGQALEGRIDVMHFYANPVTVEFLLGIGLAVLCRERFLKPSFLFSCAIPAGFFLLWGASHLPVWGGATFVGATLIVGGAVLMPPIRRNILSRLGDASYSLYLTHGIVLSALAWITERSFLQAPTELFILAGLACAFTAAFLTYAFVELPITRALKRHPAKLSMTHQALSNTSIHVPAASVDRHGGISPPA